MKKETKRLLSAEGKQEIGYIFRDGYVPVCETTPFDASLRGEVQLAFKVDWHRLTDRQQQLCLDYMSAKFNEPNQQRIRSDIEKDGFFPIRHQFVIESYDMRMFV